MKFKEMLPFASIAVIASTPVFAHAAKHKVTKPNVLIIYADDVGYGDLGFNGEKTVNTKNVDKLASEGILFTDAHCCASTSTPARYAMLTGEYAWRRKDTGIARGDAAMIIKPNQYTIADMFKSAGYYTGVVGKWHLGLGNETGKQDWNKVVTPNTSDIGFDYSYIMAATADRTPCIFMENGLGVNLDPNDPVEVSYVQNFPGEPSGKDNPEMLRLHPSHGHDQAIVNGVSRIGFMKGGEKARWRDEDIVDSIVSHTVAFLEKRKKSDQPFFLYMATNDIHVPRVPNERFQGKSPMGARGEAILSFDWSVGKVMAALKRLGLDENTIVILSSDNGPVIDDGYKDKAVELLGNHRPGGDFRGGKYSIFEAGTRVPCVVRWKNHITPGISNNPISHIDWLASFASMLKVKLPLGAGMDSENYLSSLIDANKKGREYVIEQNIQNNLSISNGEWKYIPAAKGPRMEGHTHTELGNDPTQDQLYNLKLDKGEKHNVAKENPEIVAKLSAKLQEVRNKKK